MSMSSPPREAPSEALPRRILLVDDDAVELELLAGRLRSLGFETHTAADGGAALNLLQTLSFPVVITDWQMPHMDGIGLTESLRAKGDNETYIIMLTLLEDDGTSHERGYCAGVDDYLSKRAPDARIVAGVRSAFKAAEMRQALHLVKNGTSAISDIASGALADRLRSEVKRATRYNRELSVLVLVLEVENAAAVNDAMARAAQIVTAAIRADIDFATRYRSIDGVQRIAVILPETNRSAAIAVSRRLCDSLAGALQTPLDSFTARVGCSSLSPGAGARSSQHVTADIEALLRTAEAGVRVAPLPAPARHSAAR